jgi:2-dehydropantoate 2-reductase
MNIVILGAGAVGGYIGGRLMEAGVPVSFLVRARRGTQLQKNGLRIKSIHGDYSTDAVDVYTKAEDIPSCDVVIVAVKGYHLEGALPQLKALAGKGAKVLPFLNGMEHFQVLEKELGKEKVLGGLAFIIATLDENGGIVHTSEQHDFIFGGLDSSQKEFCRQLEEVLKPVHLNTTNSPQITYALWQKYLFITAFSGITTASRLPIGRIREVPETLELFQDTLQEMRTLAAAYGVDLDESVIDGVTMQMRRLSAESTSSMHQDFRKGLPIEVENLHGGALRMAKEKGLQLPVIETLYGLLKPYEKGR